MEKCITTPKVEGTNICPVCGHKIPLITNVQFNDKFTSIQIGTKIIKLGKLKYKILKTFFDHQNQFIAAERLWAIIEARSRSGESENLLRTTISQLRRILKVHKLPYKISNNYNVGYILIRKQK